MAIDDGVTPVARRRPRWSEVKPLLGFRAPFTGPDAVQRAATINDLRTIAKRRTPRAVFDYTDGAAGNELSMQRSREAFARVEFRPRVLRDVQTVDPTRMILGRPSAQPFAFGPTGFTRMMHHEGEPAVARVAAELGIPYALSTLGTTSIEDLAATVPNARRWFQLYIWRDGPSRGELVARARDAGYEALILTVDTAVGGKRLRDVRNGLTIPPQLTMRTLANMTAHPRWWVNALTTEPLEFASLRRVDGTVGELLSDVLDPSITLAELQWLREVWEGPIVIKGVQSADDAELLAEVGVEAILLSNHGGRQLDRSVVPLELLPEAVQRVRGRSEVWIDGGVMSGADVVAAVGLGAQAVLMGRAYLYGLMAGGEAGVRRAGEILRDEVAATMRLMGVTTLEELDPGMVRLLG